MFSLLIVVVVFVKQIRNVVDGEIVRVRVLVQVDRKSLMEELRQDRTCREDFANRLR